MQPNETLKNNKISDFPVADYHRLLYRPTSDVSMDINAKLLIRLYWLLTSDWYMSSNWNVMQAVKCTSVRYRIRAAVRQCMNAACALSSAQLTNDLPIVWGQPVEWTLKSSSRYFKLTWLSFLNCTRISWNASVWRSRQSITRCLLSKCPNNYDSVSSADDWTVK